MFTKGQILSSFPHLSNKLRRITCIWIRSHSLILNLQISNLKNGLWWEHSAKRHIRHNVGFWVRCGLAFVRVYWASIESFHLHCLKISKTCAVIQNLKRRFVKIKKFGISISDFLHKLYWRFLYKFCPRVRRNIWNLNMVPCRLWKCAPHPMIFAFTRFFQRI